MTRCIEITVTDEEHALLSVVAQDEKKTVEQWVRQHAVGLADMFEGAMSYRQRRRSPRRDEGAKSKPTSALMIRCPHCNIETRSVALCDNCEGRLS